LERLKIETEAFSSSEQTANDFSRTIVSFRNDVPGACDMSSWIYLFIAGVFEIVWATSMKYSDGMSRLFPTVLMYAAGFTSFWFLSAAVERIPIGTAYAVWTGIGAVGTALMGMLLRRIHELAAPAKHRSRPRRNRGPTPLLAAMKSVHQEPEVSREAAQAYSPRRKPWVKVRMIEPRRGERTVATDS
jgi:quaternary ammonium compound-resistance protein SugE